MLDNGGKGRSVGDELVWAADEDPSLDGLVREGTTDWG